MIRILEINSVPYGSTGNIAKTICNLCNNQNDIECYFAYSWTKIKKNKVSKNEILIGSALGKLTHIILGRITGFEGIYSYIETKRFIKKIKVIKPNIIHIHNLHSCYINLKVLFEYIENSDIKVVWTLHDCWSFTGHCPHFENINCNKWKIQCYSCPLYKEYPKSILDNSKKMYQIKKNIFTSLSDDKMIIVTPSKWLNNLVKESYLNKYKSVVINNGIDEKIFKIKSSNFKKKYGLDNKKIILGVAFDWTNKKGLDIFIKLSNDLSNEYKIVLVGTNDKIDKILPKKILSIHKTTDKNELANIYSAADIFINPTREDTFPTVNIEALACGTPVITYSTGGSPEIINNSCGIVIKNNEYKTLLDEIISFDKIKYKKEDCIRQSKKYLKNDKYQEYITLFKKIAEKY